MSAMQSEGLVSPASSVASREANLQAPLETDIEQQAPLLRGSNEQRRKHRTRALTCWGAFGLALVALIVLAATTASGTGRAKRVVVLPPGALTACGDAPSLCVVELPQPTAARDYRNKPRQVAGSGGVVAADQSRCSDVGASVLEEGGNALDAAVAVVLCQGVVNPSASGLGGGFFMLLRRANGSAEFIDAREQAPGAAYWDMFNGTAANASQTGGLAAAIPLELKGLELAWRRHGSLPWARLVAPAASIARHGFAAHPYYVKVAANTVVLPVLQADPLAADALLVRDPNGTYRVPRVGEMCCKRPALADTLDAVAAHGAGWLYSGKVAEGLAADVRAAGGILTAQDLQDAAPLVSEPLRVALPPGLGSGEGYQLLTPPPPSSGAVVALVLQLLLGYAQGLGDMGAPLAAHRMVESMKHGFALRMGLGDPGTPQRPFTDVGPLLQDMLHNATFVGELRSLINDSHVQPVEAYGGRWNPLLTGSSPEDHGTTHISVLDAQGNAVSLTASINGPFGSKVVSRSTGILLNNHMDDFARPDHPNAYNLPPAAANYIRPLKRPLSSMSPSLLLSASGQLRMVVGASGGPRIITSILQTILRVLYQGQDLLAAISGPRLHAQWSPNEVQYESYSPWPVVPINTSQEVVQGLIERGNTMALTHDIGNVQAILVDPATGVATAASDPRKDGAPAAAAGRGAAAAAG